MGNKRVTQRGLTVVERDRRPEPAARPRLRPRRPRRPRGGAHRWLTPRSSAAEEASTLDDAVVRRALQRPARARVGARRAERPPPGHRVDARRAAGPRRRRQAVAPEGHRPRPRRLARARRSGPAAASSSARSRATTPSRSTARSAAPRCAARCRCTPSAARSRSLDAAPFDDTPSTKQAAALLADWAGGGSVLVVLAEDQATVALSFRNLAARHRAAGRARPASPTSSAPRACSSARTRSPSSTARANGERAETEEDD